MYSDDRGKGIMINKGDESGYTLKAQNRIIFHAGEVKGLHILLPTKPSLPSAFMLVLVWCALGPVSVGHPQKPLVVP